MKACLRFSSILLVAAAAAEAFPIPDAARLAALKTLTYGLKKARARYIHVKAKNIGVLPKWHKNASSPNATAALYFDEIVVR